MNKYKKHLLYTSDESFDKSTIRFNGVFNTMMINKYILDICIIEDNISILFLDNENSNKIKQIVFETDKY